MSKFNTAGTRPATGSPIAGERSPGGVTHEGGDGYRRDTKSELFLLAVTTMVGENTFYETSDERDTRYADLVRKAALADPEWTARFLRWLRTEANMRTAAIVGAAEYVQARLAVATDGQSSVATTANRAVVDSVLQRADEPGELLAYWTSLYGRKIPKPVKRGVADAAVRLFHEKSFLKWDSDARAFRFADVLGLAHPDPKDAVQDALFEHIVDVRFNPGREIPAELAVLGFRAELMAWDAEKRRDLFRGSELDTARSMLRRAGMTWESLAGWLQGPMDARAWEAMIPSMGYMALLRNLRNFDQAGVSDEIAEQVAARLADPDQVAKSRQFPMRFLSAYRAAPSLRWSYALEKAISESLANVPRLDGRTLILVDTSGSMNAGFSKDGTLMRWDAAAIFGIALGARCERADVVSFSNGYFGGASSMTFDVRGGESLLRALDRWKNGGYFIGGGTDTVGAIQRHLRPEHDRLVILTDEQHSTGNVDQAVPKDTALYTWNLAGYQHGHSTSGHGNRHTFGGLTDQAFRMIPLLEAGRDADWPF
ncbi:TROVE domain-containing protein [Amycolatopsis sp. WAC 04182]|uniref:TROVE domain-containing protein n=1 Tax=Amycolatopsis sp. WAC 04182 TaxID=2203198 RepID=UPI000F7B189D|nr:TROVE domain-containing protein [Amycolatopsis sp. WAC 04182]RSN63731.1 TROVE domain-containing protein [Amycolatopsis sp. WAC 04182]